MRCNSIMSNRVQTANYYLCNHFICKHFDSAVSSDLRLKNGYLDAQFGPVTDQQLALFDCCNEEIRASSEEANCEGK